MRIIPNPDANYLTDDEQQELYRDEASLERLRQAYWEAGPALRNIRDKRLYRAEYATFDHYCRARWNMERSYAYYLIEAVRVREILLTTVNISPESPDRSTVKQPLLPENERQARPLATLKNPEQVRQAWAMAVEHANGTPTAKQVSEAVKQLKGFKSPKPRKQPTVTPPDDGRSSPTDQAETEIYNYITDESQVPDNPNFTQKETSSCKWILDALQRRIMQILLYEQEVGMKIERLVKKHGKLPQTIIAWAVDALEVLPGREEKITELEIKLRQCREQALAQKSRLAELEQALAQKNDTLAELEKKLADAAQTIAALNLQQSSNPQPSKSDKPVSAPAQSEPNLKPLIDFFNKAAEKVENPTVQIHLNGNTIVVSRNSNSYSGKHPGVLNLNTGDGILQGSINRDGSLFKSQEWQGWVLPILEELAQSPGAIASLHGKATGRCCFCGGALTDSRSLSTGYGEDCASHYGLPWNPSELEAFNSPSDENNAHSTPANTSDQNVTIHYSANIPTIQQGCSAVSTTTGESLIVTGLFEQSGIQMAKIKYSRDGLEGISRVDYLSPAPQRSRGG